MEQFADAADNALIETRRRIEEFYSLRDDRLAHPERTLVRIAQEQKINPALTRELLEGLPQYLADDGTATMFDLVNAVTNLANSPSIAHKAGLRQSIEAIGGNIVYDHAARCDHCQSRLQ